VFLKLADQIPSEGLPTWDEVETSFRFWGRPSAGMFALLLEGQTDTVHFHRRSGRWAGVCYLTPPELVGARDGVVFYRHRPTGATHCPLDGQNDVARYREDASVADRWERLSAVEMAFNRMVIFDGRYFHAASPGFGTEAASARLTQLFNIDFRSK
jgi:hypothetical protein